MAGWALGVPCVRADAGPEPLAAASMAGLPPFIGFVGKEAALTALSTTPSLSPGMRVAALVAVVLGSVLTMAYSVRFVWDAFGDKDRAEPSSAVAQLHAPTASILWIPAALAVAGLVAGIGAPVVGPRQLESCHLQR